jgi:hypothetical protein
MLYQLPAQAVRNVAPVVIITIIIVMPVVHYRGRLCVCKRLEKFDNYARAAIKKAGGEEGRGPHAFFQFKLRWTSGCGVQRTRGRSGLARCVATEISRLARRGQGRQQQIDLGKDI